jgi:iron complex transport system ATP-binding protein
MSARQVISVENVEVIRDGKKILGPLSWAVHEGERWVVLGPNGAGKSTLFLLCATLIHPSAGIVRVLEEQVGKVDLFELRPRIGVTHPAVTLEIPEDERVMDVVLTSAYAILGRWNEDYDLWDESRAISLLTALGVRDLGERRFGTLSEGEKKRVLIARSLMANPEIMLLDEPASGLDLGGREDLLMRFDQLAQDPLAPCTVIVTHHIEEIPAGTTHALLLAQGKAVAMGSVTEVITSENISAAYGLPIEISYDNQRFTARATR